jgi:hypothetical protein
MAQCRSGAQIQCDQVRYYQMEKKGRKNEDRDTVRDFLFHLWLSVIELMAHLHYSHQHPGRDACWNLNLNRCRDVAQSPGNTRTVDRWSGAEAIVIPASRTGAQHKRLGLPHTQATTTTTTSNIHKGRNSDTGCASNFNPKQHLGSGRYAVNQRPIHQVQQTTGIRNHAAVIIRSQEMRALSLQKPAKIIGMQVE